MYYSSHPWQFLAVWEGGLAYFGGLFGAVTVHWLGGGDWGAGAGPRQPSSCAAPAAIWLEELALDALAWMAQFPLGPKRLRDPDIRLSVVHIIGRSNTSQGRTRISLSGAPSRAR
jgi:Prolipoprotein diacylglyceryl transferase